MNVITARQTFATYENAYAKLERVLLQAGTTPDQARWLIAVKIGDNDEERYVPTLVGIQYAGFAHAGIMVIS